MGVSFKLLSPSVQDGKEAGFGTEVFGIHRHFEKGGSTGFEQQRKQPALVLPHERHEDVRHAKDQVVVANGQQFLLTLLQPLVASVALALRAVPIAARVVRDGFMTAARAQIAMPTESSRTAAGNGFEHLDLWPGQECGVGFAECPCCNVDDVGHLEGRPAHPLAFSSAGPCSAMVSWSSGLTAACIGRCRSGCNETLNPCVSKWRRGSDANSRMSQPKL